MQAGTNATHEAIEETNNLLQTLAERVQLVADRVAETNELLGVMAQAAPRGSPAQAVRANRGDAAPSQAAPYQQHGTDAAPTPP